ncbi:MAG: VWA domain-containing protein [Actinomycetota bacterium]|nr:VWA domain-containing protein [Actinomycetota bacterium]
MLEVLSGFVGELRASGLPVSLTEAVDAALAVDLVAVADRSVLRSSLAATLVKSSEHLDAFERAFDVYFSPRGPAPDRAAADASPAPPGTERGEGPDEGATQGGDVRSATLDPSALRGLAAGALRSGDQKALAAVARAATGLFAGVEPGRPVGVSYYLYRTLRGLDLEGILADLLHAAVGPGASHDDEILGPVDGPLAARLVADELEARAAELRRLVEQEIRRALVAERGTAAVARSLRRPLVEDVDFMHASGEDLDRIRRALFPLARSLAVRLARRRRSRRRGSLDFRATIRRSLQTGGVPADPRFHRARPAKPEILVVADVSGSVASFARFTLHLVHALAAQFSNVRIFVFVDGIDEVTAIFSRSASIAEAVARVAAEADVVHLDGHSDYGNAFGAFARRWGREVTSRTNVIVLGDARNNYHATNEEALAEVARRARRVYWLNPEPRAYWGTGDSVLASYAPLADGVFECRNLRQLERFVDVLG